ncbi:MAG: AsmA-like C-terminal region-containing protein [Chitinophagales bacterium]
MVRKVLAVFSIFLLVASSLVMGGTALLENKIKTLAVEKINAQIAVPVKVSGGITLSLFKHFPYASISFKNVTINDKLRPGKTLLQLEELSLLMNVPSLFKEEQEVTKIYAGNGDIDIFINNKGAANYDIFKTDDKVAASKFKVLLKTATLEDIRLGYYNEEKNELVVAALNHLTLSGNFSDKEFDLNTNADVKVRLVQVNEEKYIENKAMTADMLLHVDQIQQKFSIQRAALEVAKNEFVLSGYWKSMRNRTDVNFKAESKGEDVANLIALIPDQLRKNLVGADGNGNYTITATVIGSVSKGVNPEVKVEAMLRDATIRLPKLSRALEKVNASGFYKLKADGADELQVKKFESYFHNEPFGFSLDLRKISAPDFDLSAHGTVDVEEARSFFGDSILENAEGKIDIADLHLSGNIPSWKQLDQAAVRGEGALKLREVEFQTDGITYGNINGTIQFEDEKLRISALSINFLNTDFLFNGTVENPLNYGLGLAKKKTENITLGFNGDLKMKVCNLGNMIAAYDKKKKRAAAEGDKIDIRNVFNMEGALRLSIGKLIYNKMNFNEVSGEVSLSPHHINLSRLTSHAMGGNIAATGAVAFLQDKEMELLLDLKIDKVELPQIFQQCDNFGQTTLTDKNLKGDITATTQFKTVWKNYKDVDLHQLEGQLQCRIGNGELLNFEPIRAASQFIKVEELNRIVFSELSNTLFIKNGVISVPQMEVNSSALNLMLNGTHTFENQIDYHLKINLTKLLAAKFSRRNADVQYIEEDPYEGTNLFLTLSGPLSDPHIHYDKKAVNSKIKQDFADEREELKSLFKNEKPKAKNEKERTREDKYFDTRSEPVFMDLDEEK